jgi:hypothetical protein
MRSTQPVLHVEMVAKSDFLKMQSPWDAVSANGQGKRKPFAVTREKG